MDKCELIIMKAENGCVLYETKSEDRKYFVARANYELSDIIRDYFKEED